MRKQKLRESGGKIEVLNDKSKASKNRGSQRQTPELEGFRNILGKYSKIYPGIL